MKKLVLVAFAVIFSFSLSAQTFTNCGFEYFGDPGMPANWRAVAGEIRLDSIVKYSGKYSARVTAGESPTGFYSLVTTAIPGHIVVNKKIEVRAKLKRELADSINTAIFVQKADGRAMSPPLYSKWLAGQGDWMEVSLESAPEPSLQFLYVGAIATGAGSFWLDDIEVYADGELLDYTPRTSPLTESEAGWLWDNTYPIYPEPDGRVGDLIGDPRVVGLGEVTHGARDIGEARYQMSKYLIEKKGITIIALESATDLTLEKINEYISHPSEQVAENLGTDVGTIEFIKWIAEYNLRTGRNVRFMGAENGQIELIIEHVDRLQNGEIQDQLTTLRHTILPVSRALPMYAHPEFSLKQKEKVLAALTACRDWAQQNMADAMDLDLMMHNLELIEKYIDMSDEKRDSIMADNIEWISRRYPNEKIIFWAHNLHTEIRGAGDNQLYSDGSVGYHLRQKFGNDYYTIGACFFEGSYKAFIPELVGGKTRFNKNDFPAISAFPGSYEYLFNSIAKPDFFLPLRGVRTDEDNLWLAGPMEFRTIGAVYAPYGFSPISLLRRFDAVVFIRETKPVEYFE